jgi:hypothetical protein
MERSISARIQRDLYDIRNQNFPRDQKTVNALDWLFDQLAFSLVIDCDGDLLIKNGKNPSGCANTLDDNTLVEFMIVFYTICRNYPSDNVEEILTKAYTIVGKMGGDDKLLADNPAITNIITYAKEMGFDMGYEVPYPTPFSKAQFYSQGFHFDVDHRMYIPKFNFRKLLASVFWWRKANSWRLTMAKLCALRLLTYPYKNEFLIIEKLIDFVHFNYKNDMKVEKRLDDKLTYESLLSMLLSTSQMEYIWYGLESKTEANIPDWVKYLEIDC